MSAQTTASSLFALVLGLLAPAAAAAQDPKPAQPETAPAALHEPPGAERSRERALEKTRQMLERRPGHAALFDRYFVLLIEGNAVDAEIARVQARLEEDPEDRSGALVLGRLMLRAGKEQEALEVLDDLVGKAGADDHEAQGVLGAIYFKLGRFNESARAYEAALGGARTAETKRVVIEKLGQCQLALGSKAKAIATWQQIAELDGGKFFRVVRVAELLTEAGLLEEAAAAYEPLLADTVDDPERHCRVLRDYGRLQELRGQLDDALTTYQKVMELTARGNWLRKAVEQRTVQIFRRTGRLDELSQELGERVASNPEDLPAVELYADVLVEMRDLEKAVTVLAAATPSFPKDVRLARRLAELYVEREDVEKAIAEYQRILSERPDQLELYLELGTLFARGEQFDAAKNQWEKALAQHLKDATLCTRIASMYALWERHDDAARLYERAIELQPNEMVRYLDLSAFLRSVRRSDEARAVLERALAVAHGVPRRLEVLVGAFREFDMNDRVGECLGEILQLEPDNYEARYSLAQHLLRTRETERAVALLWEVVDGKPRGAESGPDGAGYRTEAANTLINLATRSGNVDTLIADAKKRETAGAAFVLGRALSRQREFEDAVAAFQLAVERDPIDLDARRLLARMLASQGEYEAALEAYRQLQMVAPGERQRSFREVARLHLEMYDTEQAIAVWQGTMRLNPDNPSVFLTVGKEFMDIQRIPEALEAFRQALRLKPNNPDVQFRLAAALQRSGKLEDAEAQFLEIAIGAVDHVDREEARDSLFKLYAEQGRIDERIEELQAAIEENIYDPDAPQLLADLYLRSHDYVLGLQLLEKSLQFQPRNKELLARRAELLEALEEWDSARVAHEELLKFPDADRDLHLSGVARSLYEVGRAEEAKKIFAKVRDRGRVSELYEKYRLYDEAIEYWQREIARNPRDIRAYRALGKQLANRNRNDEAITVFERALDVRPFDRVSLNELGKLYIQVDRRGEAVAIGKQIFGLRGEGEKKTRKEELREIKDDNRWSSYNRFSVWNSFSQRRLNSAQQYFNERGLQKEWQEILLEEAARRPTNLPLFQAVQNLYSWQDKSAKKLEAFLIELLARDLRAERMPPGHTPRSFRQMAEQALVTVWSQDAAVAEARLQQLAGAEGSAESHLERAVLLRALGKTDDMVAELRAAIAADADSAVARKLLLDHLIEKKEYAEAVTHLRALAAWWDGPGADYQRELEARRALTFRAGRRNRYQELPRRVRRRVDDDVLRAVDARVETESFAGGGMPGATVFMGYYNPGSPPFRFPEMTPRPFAISTKLISVLRAMGAEDAEIDAAIEDALQRASNLGRRASLAGLLFTEQRRARAEPLLRDVMEEARTLRSDSLQVYFWTSYQWIANTAAGHLADILVEQKKYLDAYRLLTDFGDREKAEGIAREHDQLAVVVEHLVAAVAEQAERLREAQKSGGGREIRAIELDYRDAVIQLCNFVLADKDYESAEKFYRESLELLPNDIAIRGVVAQLQLRRGDAVAAVATHYEIIDAKRRERRAKAGEWAPPPTRLQPSLPRTQNDPFGGVYFSSGIAFSSPYMYSYGYNDTNVATNYQQILQIYSKRNDHAALLDALRQMVTEDPTVFRSIAYQAIDMLKNQDLGKKKLPILRMFRGYAKDRTWMRYDYAEACKEADELKEAERALEEIITDATDPNDYYVDRAGRLLEQVRQKLGKHLGGIAELEKKVAAEPDNVRHRLQLADLLKKKHDHAGVLEQARIVVDKAPYMTRAKTMLVEAAAAVGDDELVVEMLNSLYEDAKAGQEKMARGVALANWLFSSGQKDEAYAIVDGLETEMGGSDDFMPSNWYLDRHEKELALNHLRGELDKLKSRSWYGSRVRPRLARIEMATDHEADAMERYLESVREAGSLQEREQRFKELLAVVRGHPDPEALEAALTERHGARESIDDLLVMAACAFARGDAAAGERELEKAVAMSPKEVYLFPLLLGLKRQRHEYAEALEVLDQMERVYGGSSQMQWASGFSVSEKDRLKIERAIILRLMERVEESDQLIESIADETSYPTFATVSAIYRRLEEFDKALSWQQKYNEKLGSKNKGSLLADAKLFLELDRLDDALQATERARKMAPGDGAVRGQLIQIHRKLGTLAAFAAQIAEDYEKDIRDAGLRSSLLAVYGELGKEAEQRAIYEALIEIPEEREAALNALLTRARNAEDIKAAIGYQQQLIELKGGQEKERAYSALSSLQLEIGDIEAAAESYSESLDLDTSAGLLKLARWLERRRETERALETYRLALELDPEEYSMHVSLAKDAHDNKRWREVVDTLVELSVRSHGKASLPSDQHRGWVMDALDGIDESERSELLSGGETAAEHERAALLHYCRGDCAAAAKHARAAIDAGDEGVSAWQVLHATAEPESLEARLELLAGYHRRLERESAMSKAYNYTSRAESLQRERAMLYVALGRPDEASRMWRGPLFRKANTDSNLSYYRSDWQVRFATDKWLGVYEPEQAWNALRDEFLVYERPPWRNYFKTLLQLKKYEELEAMLWPRVLDPLQAYQVGSGSRSVNASDYQGPLVDTYQKTDRMDELLVRIEEAASRPETEKQAKSLRKVVASKTRDYEFTAAEAERVFEEDRAKPENDGKLLLSRRASLVQSWTSAKNWARVREHLDYLLDFSSPELTRRLGPIQTNSNDWTMVQSTGGSFSTTNPFSLTLQGGSGGYSYYSSSSSSYSRSRMNQQRELAIVALRKLGEAELADRCEAALWQRALADKVAGAMHSLASHFQKHELFVDAERVLRAELALENLDDGDRKAALARLCDVLERAGDTDGRRLALTERRRVLEREIADAPGPHALPERLALANLLIELEDWDAAVAELDKVSAHRLSSVQYDDRRAYLELRRGNPAAAVALFRGIEQHNRQRGMPRGGLSRRHRVHLGLALAAAGESAEARELLEEAVDFYTDQTPLGREIRAALAK